MNKMILLLTFISQVFLLSNCKKNAPEPISLQKIKKEVIAIAKERHIPSMELTISTPTDALNFSYNNPDVEKQDIYGVASVTKFLSAVYIFKLIENGQLTLDDTITDYVSNILFIGGIENITIRELLNHTSGLADFTQHPTWVPSVIDGNPPVTFNEKLLLVDSTLTNSGTFAYSNTNYLFLQEAVATITNKSYDIAFEDFYAANGLSNIQIGTSDPNIECFFAQTEDTNQSSTTWDGKHGFAGGAFTSPRDLNDFSQKLFAEKSILNSSSIALMKEWVNMGDFVLNFGSGQISNYGNGIMRLDYNNKEYFGHFGSSLRYQSMVLFNEEDDVAISIATNCSGRYYSNIIFMEILPEILDGLE